MSEPNDSPTLAEKLAGKEYLTQLPSEVPPGRLLVHNQVRPARMLGERGFRAWLQEPSAQPPLVRCDCGWAPELGAHFRVDRGEGA